MLLENSQIIVMKRHTVLKARGKAFKIWNYYSYEQIQKGVFCFQDGVNVTVPSLFEFHMGYKH
jgi:hypothetical protein